MFDNLQRQMDLLQRQLDAGDYDTLFDAYDIIDDLQHYESLIISEGVTAV